MKFFLNIIIKLLGGLSLIALQLIIISFLSFPVPYFNMFMIGLLWWFLITDDRYGVPIALAFIFIVEICSALPVGNTMGPIILSLILVRWLGTRVFTNRSIYMIIGAGGIGLMSYELLLLGSFWIKALIFKEFFIISSITFINIIETWVFSMALFILLHLLSPLWRLRKGKIFNLYGATL